MISIPFPGSKFYSYKEVRKIAENGNYFKAFEPFGGSCIITANLYNEELVETGYINDFDRLFDIYGDFLNVKDRLVATLKAEGLEPTGHNHKIGHYRITKDGIKIPVKSRVQPDWAIEILQREVDKIDRKYWRLLTYGSNFTFSSVMTHEKIFLRDFRYFMGDIGTEKQRKYLEVIKELDRTCFDYRQFFEYYEIEFDDRSLLIVDPPYIDAYQRQYSNENEFTYEDTKKLLKLCVKAGCDFVFFNGNGFHVRRLFDELGIKPEFIKELGNRTGTANRNRYDVMAFVKGWR